MISRRLFAAGLAGTLLPIARADCAPMLRWEPGILEVHFIATGRGDATLIITPSGRMILIDVGAARDTSAAMVAPLPDAALPPGRRVARYVKRKFAETGRQGLDALAVTHFHDDHIGGIADLLDEIEVWTILDRAWPDYGYPPFEGPAGAEYAAMVRDRASRGQVVKRLNVGADDQFGPIAQTSGAPFRIRTAAAGGVVWTGKGTASRRLFPQAGTLVPSDVPNENANSAAFLVSLGRFRCFLGGDLTDWADAGARPWLNALSPAALACCPVHVSTLPHHGMFDGSSAATIRALAARDWVISAWHAAHPSIETLERAFNERLYNGPRDVWATTLHPAAELSMARLTRRFASRRGNIVCRVEEGGTRWSMIVTEPSSEDIVSTSAPRSTS